MEQENKKKSFLIYYDNEVIVCRLPDEEAGKLFKSLFPYGKQGIKPDFEYSPALAMAFDIIKLAIDRDNEKYADICERNRVNISKRWNKDNTTVYGGIRPYTNNTDKDKDKDKGKDNDNFYPLPLSLQGEAPSDARPGSGASEPPLFTFAEVLECIDENGIDLSKQQARNFFCWMQKYDWTINGNRVYNLKNAISGYAKKHQKKKQEAKEPEPEPEPEKKFRIPSIDDFL